jgi:hypothetical protein
MNPLAYLDKWFTACISDRRSSGTSRPRWPPSASRMGSLPEVVDVVRIATFLFIELLETES